MGFPPCEVHGESCKLLIDFKTLVEVELIILITSVAAEHGLGLQSKTTMAIRGCLCSDETSSDHFLCSVRFKWPVGL